MGRTDWRLIILLESLALLLGGCGTTQPASTPAVGPQSSWEEIRNTPGLISLPPQIFFGTTGVAVTDVCLDGDTLGVAGTDGRADRVLAAGHPLHYAIGVGIQAGDAETSTIRVLFIKSFDIPACQ